MEWFNHPLNKVRTLCTLYTVCTVYSLLYSTLCTVYTVQVLHTKYIHTVCVSTERTPECSEQELNPTTRNVSLGHPRLAAVHQRRPLRRDGEPHDLSHLRGRRHQDRRVDHLGQDRGGDPQLFQPGKGRAGASVQKSALFQAKSEQTGLFPVRTK